MFQPLLCTVAVVTVAVVTIVTSGHNLSPLLLALQLLLLALQLANPLLLILAIASSLALGCVRARLSLRCVVKGVYMGALCIYIYTYIYIYVCVCVLILDSGQLDILDFG